MEFEVPEFLKNSSVDEVHGRMLDNLPDNLDKSELETVWDLTRPTAIEKAEMMEYIIPHTLMLIWPQFATGIYLDYHGDARNLHRKGAVFAKGFLEVSAKEGTRITTDSIFSTESKNGLSSIDYVVTEDCLVDETGTVVVPIVAAIAGSSGNAASGTITINSSRIEGITAISNLKEVTGGRDEEEDEPYRERIMEYDRSIDESFVGNEADYKRWAESVKGTGKAKVISAKDDSGLVTIVLTDRDGEPAPDDLCKSVYDYIMSPNNEKERLAPVNAYLKVVAPDTVNITVSAVVELRSGSVEDARLEFVSTLRDYLPVAINEGKLRYSKVGSILEENSFTFDYTDLKVNGGTENVRLEENYTPKVNLKDVVFTTMIA